MKILVTGGNGYVGRTLCRLLRIQHDLCIIDNVRYGTIRFAPQELANLRFEQVDIRDKQAVHAVIANFNPDVIIHLAAIHFIPECENEPDLAVSTNVNGTVNLLSACPSHCRFVFASSGAVYEPEYIPHREDCSPIQPSDIYGFTKLHGENYVRYFAQKNNFQACIVRLFNVIGSGETNPHILPEIIAQLKAGYKVLKLGNLTPQRDYICVDDAATGFISAALDGNINAGTTTTVNLGTQIAHSVEYLLNELRDISKINFAVEIDPMRLRKIDRPYLAADRSQIKSLFNWEPKYTFESTLRAMWINPELPDYLTKKYMP